MKYFIILAFGLFLMSCQENIGQVISQNTPSTPASQSDSTAPNTASHISSFVTPNYDWQDESMSIREVLIMHQDSLALLTVKEEKQGDCKILRYYDKANNLIKMGTECADDTAWDFYLKDGRIWYATHITPNHEAILPFVREFFTMGLIKKRKDDNTYILIIDEDDRVVEGEEYQKHNNWYKEAVKLYF